MKERFRLSEETKHRLVYKGAWVGLFTTLGAIVAVWAANNGLIKLPFLPFEADVPGSERLKDNSFSVKDYSLTSKIRSQTLDR
ncbi:hypothetical protein HYS94_03905 [Candidatus Daviesbacteria bacterium]|nr:hypothetical protein [Candidatus Daviesbacteria bacterium]